MASLALYVATRLRHMCKTFAGFIRSYHSAEFATNG